MPSKNHVHRYSRVLYGANKKPIMRCTLDDCSHSLIDPKMAIHRKSICWNCGSTFELLAKDLKAKPTCNCKRPKMTIKKDTNNDVENIMNQFSLEDIK